MSKDLDWLIVGGCARSGTTILGQLVSSGEGIGLLHETPSWFFFDNVDRFFAEEERHKQGNAFHVHKSSLFLRDDMEQPLIEFLFRQKFGDGLRIIGTKTPNYYDLAEPSLPSYVRAKTLHITRDPVTNVDSLVNFVNKSPLGGDFIVPSPADHGLLLWMRAWNAAILQTTHATDGYFQHLFIDDLLEDPEGSVATIQEFLGHNAPLDTSMLRGEARRVDRSPEGWRLSTGESLNNQFANIPEIAVLQANWPIAAKRSFDAGKYMGWPLYLGEEVSFKPSGRGVYYRNTGFAGPTGPGVHLGNLPGLLTMRLPEAKPEVALTLDLTFTGRLGVENRPFTVNVRSASETLGCIEVKNDDPASVSLKVPPSSLQNKTLPIVFEADTPLLPRSFINPHSQAGRMFVLASLTLRP